MPKINKLVRKVEALAGRGTRRSVTKHVVVSTESSKRKKKKVSSRKMAKRHGRGRAVSGVTDEQRYALALKDPFDPLCVGVRIPDIWSYPTACTEIKTRFVISSASVSGSNIINGMFLPNPLCPYMDCVGSGNVSGLTAYAGAPGIYYLATSAQLAAVMCEARVVSWGVTLKGLAVPTAVTGSLIVAPTPTSNNLPAPGDLANNSNTFLASNVLDVITNIPLTGTSPNLIASTVLTWPTATEYTLQEIISDTILITGRPTGPTGITFRSCDNALTYISGTSGFTEGQYLDVVNSTGVASAASITSSTEMQDMRGLEGMAIVGQGLPSGAILDVEYILHLEYVPQPYSSGVSWATVAPVEDVRSTDPTAVQRAIAESLETPSARLWSDVMGAGVDLGGRFLMHMIKSKLGISTM